MGIYFFIFNLITEKFFQPFIGRPYRLTEMERADPKHREKIFRLACTWSSFTINREDVNWMYNTFLRKSLTRNMKILLIVY